MVGLPALEAMVCGWLACPGGGYVVWLACLPWRGWPWYVVGLPALERAMWLVCLPWRGPWYVVGSPALERMAMVCAGLPALEETDSVAAHARVATQLWLDFLATQPLLRTSRRAARSVGI